MMDITTMTMEDYNRWMRYDNGLGIIIYEIPDELNFEIKGHILNMLTDIPLFRKNHEDAYKLIDEVLDTPNFFNVPNVQKYVVMLWMLLVTLKDATKDWLKSISLGSITTWDKMMDEFIQQSSIPSKVSMLKRPSQTSNKMLRNHYMKHGIDKREWKKESKPYIEYQSSTIGLT